MSATTPPAANGQHPSSPGGVDDGASRDAHGRFAKGNALGRQFAEGNKAAPGGNRFTRALADARRSFVEAISLDELRVLARTLYERALAGDVVAARLTLAYRVGKPVAAPDPDDVESGLDAWRRLLAWPTFEEALGIVDRAPPDVAAELVLASGARRPAELVGKFKAWLATQRDQADPGAMAPEEDDDNG